MITVAHVTRSWFFAAKGKVWQTVRSRLIVAALDLILCLCSDYITLLLNLRVRPQPTTSA